MSHIRISHVTQTNESCHTYEWVMWHTRMSHVTHTNESCDTYEWVMSHIRMSHVTHTNESETCADGDDEEVVCCFQGTNSSHELEYVRHLHKSELCSHVIHTHKLMWLRLVGPLKLQVSFAEYSLFYRALFQRKPIVLQSCYIYA